MLLCPSRNCDIQHALDRTVGFNEINQFLVWLSGRWAMHQLQDCG